MMKGAPIDLSIVRSKRDKVVSYVTYLRFNRKK